MNHSIKQIAINALGGAGCFPTRATPTDQLRELIASLHPYHSPRGLIRLGPSGDGGYLVPDDLDGIHACFSPGVNVESGFELACAERGMQVFMADRSVEGPAARHPRFSFSRCNVGAFSEPGVTSMDDWVSASDVPASADLMLQMDIEGAEFETLLATSRSLLGRFRVIVVEFHALNELLGLAWFQLARAVFRKLLDQHVCVHLHPNEVYPSVAARGLEIPPYMEFTFLRRDRMGPSPWEHETRFPHPLDASNVGGAPIVLPPCWYGTTAR